MTQQARDNQHHLQSLETKRLLIRGFVSQDLDWIHQILDKDLATADFGTEGAMTREERQQWLEWSILNYREQAQLYQPPYGERAIVLKATGELIGACGFVPCLAPFEQLAGLFASASADRAAPALYTPEFGLFYAISPAQQRQGYATEATHAMIRLAFDQLRLKRIVATTTYDNHASISVMQRLGMQIHKNPQPEPFWLQIVGVLENGQ